MVRRLLHLMLKKNPAERASLSDVLQDTELTTALQNPLDGQMVTLHTHHTRGVIILFSLQYRTLV